MIVERKGLQVTNGALRETVWGVALLVSLCAQSARGQTSSPDALSPSVGTVSIEPFVGAMWDDADVGEDRNQIGGVLGARLGYGVTPSVRIVGDFAYSRSYDVVPRSAPPSFIYDYQWLFATAGAEVVVVPGRARIAIGAQGGAAWRRTIHDGEVGTPVETGDWGNSWGARGVVVGSTSLLYQIVPRVALALSARAYVVEQRDINPALTVGVSIH